MNWGAIAKIGLGVASIVVPQIGVIENVAKALPGLSGKAKEDAVVTLAREALAASEQVSHKDLLDDKAVEAATRTFIQSYVALQNVIASRPTGPAN